MEDSNLKIDVRITVDGIPWVLTADGIRLELLLDDDGKERKESEGMVLGQFESGTGVLARESREDARATIKLTHYRRNRYRLKSNLRLSSHFAPLREII